MPAASSHIARALLACVVIVGGFALWTVVPVAWMYMTGELVSGGGARFLMVMFGCPLTMALVFVLLSTAEGRRRSLSPSEPLPLLEVTLVASAVIAVFLLVGWWAFLADSPNPSGPLQPI